MRGVALRGIGRVADALRVFEDAIKETPTKALAWEQAARCCDELAAAARGKLRARWTTRANRYAKLALRFGRPIEPTRDRRKQRGASSLAQSVMATAAGDRWCIDRHHP